MKFLKSQFDYYKELDSKNELENYIFSIKNDNLEKEKKTKIRKR